MFLKRLTIANDSLPIREIVFRKGLNLIVDDTATSDSRESGNNVGKTTILRLIDFCLGGNGKNIYSDPEFKEKANTHVETYLTENNVVVTMVLSSDLDAPHAREIVIRRNFLKRSQKVLEINGEQQTEKSFTRELKRLIFHSNAEKPKFRQIISKNIRYEKDRLTNTVRVLGPYGRPEEYESLFLFWLGINIDTDARKQDLLRNRRGQNSLLEILKRDTSLSQIEQSLIVLARTIAELERRRDSFGVNKSYEEELSQLHATRHNISELSTGIGRDEMRRGLLLESKRELENEVSSVDAKWVQALYDEARLLIPDLQRTFEDTLQFHNRMVQSRMEFITKDLPEIEFRIARERRDLSQLLAMEAELADRLRESGVVDDLRSTISELNSAFEHRGALEEQRRLWTSATDEIESIDAELLTINRSLVSKNDLVQRRIAEFNRYFADISSRLYGEQFILSSAWDDKGLDLKISSIGGNLGTGKKRGQIAAFDLAYIRFADDVGIKCLRFVLQDQIENVHDNQISSLLSDLVAEVNCQYVLPVLRDKLPDVIDVASCAIVVLSQSDKLFRIP